MNYSICSVLGALFLVSAQASQVPPTVPKPHFSFSYIVPAIEPSCTLAAQSLAIRLASLLGLRVLNADCTGVLNLPANGKIYQQYALLITYEADFAIKPLKVSLGFGESDGGSTRNTHGTYATYAGCLSDLNNQISLFQLETETQVLVATCDPALWDETGEFAPSFLVQADSYSLAKKKPYFIVEPDTDVPVQLARYRKLVSYLLEVSNATIARQSGPVTVYYSNQPLNQRLLGTFYSESQCQAQIDDAKRIFRGAGSRFSDSVCMRYSKVGPKGHIYTLLGVGTQGEVLSSYMFRGPFIYGSFDYCLADKPRVLEEVGRGAEPPVVGAICSDAMDYPGAYQMDVWSYIPPLVARP